MKNMPNFFIAHFWLRLRGGGIYALQIGQGDFTSGKLLLATGVDQVPKVWKDKSEYEFARARTSQPRWPQKSRTEGEGAKIVKEKLIWTRCWRVAKGSSISRVAKLQGDKNAEWKLPNGRSRSYREKKTCFSLHENEISRSYRVTNQHLDLPWNFVTHAFLDPTAFPESLTPLWACRAPGPRVPRSLFLILV